MHLLILIAAIDSMAVGFLLIISKRKPAQKSLGWIDADYMPKHMENVE